MTARGDPATPGSGARAKDCGLGRLLFAVAASAALFSNVVATGAEPRAFVQGEVGGELKQTIEKVIGVTDRPVENRFEARRRARAAAEDAIAVLRSEGYYAYQVEPDVSDGDPPRPIVQITAGPQFVLKGPILTWDGVPPDPAAAAVAIEAIALKAGSPGRAVEVIGAGGRVLAAIQKRGYADAEAGAAGRLMDGTIPRSFLDAYGSPPDPDQLQDLGRRLGKQYELALVFTWIAGLLNVLVIWDCLFGPAYGFGDEHLETESDENSTTPAPKT